jgi:hypothetical protein
MKPMATTVLRVAALLGFGGEAAWAQGANDRMAEFRTCSLKTRADQLECLEKLSRASMMPVPSAPQESSWTTSVTTSPVDYSPIAVATTSSREVASGSEMQLSIRCRGGRTELAVAGPATSGRGEDYAIFYRINGGQAVQVAAAPASSAGVAFKSDAAGLVQRLPGQGEFTVRVQSRTGAAQDVTFSLVGLDLVREKMTAACKWPHAVAKSDN